MSNYIRITEWKRYVLFTALSALSAAAVWLAGTHFGFIPEILVIGDASVAGAKVQLLYWGIYAAGLVIAAALLRLERNVFCKFFFTVALPAAVIVFSRYALLVGNKVAMIVLLIYFPLEPLVVTAVGMSESFLDRSLSREERLEFLKDDLTCLLHEELPKGIAFFAASVMFLVTVIPGASDIIEEREAWLVYTHTHHRVEREVEL